MEPIQIVQILAFLLLTTFAFVVSGKKYVGIYRNISMGKAEDSAPDRALRWKNMLRIALGQGKMFANLPAAILHLCVYVAFVFTQIELIEIFADGFTGSHRILYNSIQSSWFTGLYTAIISTIEVLSLLALIATFFFLARRNMLSIPRFRKAEMEGWPHRDANIILYWEIVLVTCIFLMNGADAALYPDEYEFIFSSNLGPALLGGLSESTLHLLERIGWWGHITGVLGFLIYLPYSKHLHILLAFPNTFYARQKPAGQIDSLESVTQEIKLMMNPDTAFAAADPNAEIPTFGAKDVGDLTWKNLLDAYSCTECGRCTDQCPANLTGKKLSPRKVMMDTRDRMEELAAFRKGSGEEHDGKSLISDEYVSVEELRACTTCNACVEACPVMINPLDIIIQMRRNLILEQSNSPEEWNALFNSIENSNAAWAFPASDRLKWTEN